MAAPNIRTVGTGKTYATIGAAIAAAGTVAGDIIEVYSGAGGLNYNETVNDAKGLFIRGMVPNQGIRIYNAVGGYVFTGFALQNVTVENTQNNGSGILVSYMCAGCKAKGTGAGMVNNIGIGANGNYDNMIVNCVSYMFHRGFDTDLAGRTSPKQCTACKCNIGFGSSAGNAHPYFYCLAAGNATADFQNGAATSRWNVSGDASAPGSGSVTGFNTADFVNYAGNDFRISQAARLTTVARLPGYSIINLDHTRRRRNVAEGVEYPGAFYCFEQPTWGVGELSGIG